MKKSSNRSMILTQKLESISRKIFEEHKKIIIKFIGNKPGVYALYDEKELYYVGRAIDLAERVKYHLKDQHSALWTHFSVYFTKKVQYANDIEAVIISIAQPKGNKVKPKIGKETKLKGLISKAIQEKQRKKNREDLIDLGLGKKKQVKLRKKNKNRPDLKNYFKKDKPLMRTYKGKIYKVTLLKSGKIKYKNKIYKNLTAAARVMIQKKYPRSAFNRWRFWRVKDSKNKWVKLSDLD